MYYSDKKSLVPEILFLTIAVGAGHLFFEHNSLYFLIPKLDMVMHFLGGLLIGLITLKLLFTGKRSDLAHNKRRLVFWVTLLGVMVVGLGWELFEYFVGLTPFSAIATEDTLSDLVFDAAGGVVAVLWYYKKIWRAG